MVFSIQGFRVPALIPNFGCQKREPLERQSTNRHWPALTLGSDQFSRKQTVLFRGKPSLIRWVTDFTGDFLQKKREEVRQLAQTIEQHPEASQEDKNKIFEYKRIIDTETEKSERVAKHTDFGLSVLTGAVGGIVFFFEKVSGTVLTTIVPVVGRFSGNMTGDLHYKMTRTRSLKDYENAVKRLALDILNGKADSTAHTFDDQGRFYQLKRLPREIKAEISNDIVQYQHLSRQKRYKDSWGQADIEDRQQKIVDKVVACIKQHAEKDAEKWEYLGYFEKNKSTKQKELTKSNNKNLHSVFVKKKPVVVLKSTILKKRKKRLPTNK